MNKHILGFFALSALVLACFIGTHTTNAQTYSFSRDLSFGVSGDDVANLQSWLIMKGFDIPAVSSNATPRGFFGMQTQRALAAFQRSIGLPAYGFFGPMTRARFGNGDNDGGNSQVSLTITSPNGGEVWQKGTTQYITWNGSNSVLNQTADIRLEYPTPACALPTQPIRCMIMVRAPITIAQGVNLNTRSYAWNVGIAPPPVYNGISNGLMTNVDPGQYKIQICPTNGSQCAESKDNFTIASGETNGGSLPVINGLDAPTTLATNQVGTWTIHATDALNGTLSYSVLWGDEAGMANTGGTMMVPAVMQTSTFTHSYANAGTYMVTFIVRNSSGQSVQTSSSVQVTGTTSAGPLRIVSPNGNEVWQTGSTQTITWTSPYYFAAAYADLKLVKYGTPCANQMMPCPLMALAPYTIATNIPINQNSYSWNVGSAGYPSNTGQGIALQTVPDGQYTIQLCQSGTNSCDSSDAPFTITSGTSAKPLTVVAPNGGEVWAANTTQTIRWNSIFDPNARLDLYLGHLIYAPCVYGAACPTQFQTSYILDKNISSSNPYNWIVATDINNQPIPAGNYAVEVCLAGFTTNCGLSNNSFTITR